MNELLLVSLAGMLSGTQVDEDALWTKKTEDVQCVFIWLLLHAGLDWMAVHRGQQIQRR